MRLLLIFALAVSSFAQSWSLVSNAPNTRVYTVLDIHTATGIGTTSPHPTVLYTTRACGVGGVPTNTCGMWYSSDLGVSWTTLLGGSVDSSGDCTSDTCVSGADLNCNGEIVYTVQHGGSSTRVTVWYMASNTTATAATNTSGGATLQGFWYRVRKDPSSCDIYGWDQQGNPWRSTDNGHSYTKLDSLYGSGLDPGAGNIRDDGVCFSMNDGQVTYERNPCSTGTSTSVGQMVNPVLTMFAPDNSVWGCDANNNPRKWDGVTSWNLVTITGAHTYRCHGATRKGTDFYIVGVFYDLTPKEGPHVYKSTNNGSTWSAADTGITFGGTDVQSIIFDCEGNGWVGGDAASNASYVATGVYSNTCASTPVTPALSVSGNTALAGGMTR